MAEKLLIDIETGGLKPGEMAVIAVSRNTGKSIMFNNLCQEIFGPMKIETIESKIHGARITGLRIHGSADWPVMESWCYKTYGAKSDPFDLEIGRWYANNRTFWFRDERDITWFKLRWA